MCYSAKIARYEQQRLAKASHTTVLYMSSRDVAQSVECGRLHLFLVSTKVTSDSDL